MPVHKPAGCGSSFGPAPRCSRLACSPRTTAARTPPSAGGRIVGVPVALLLLHDLRETYVTAHAAEIACVILGQAAKAERDAELVATAEQGLEEAD